MADSGSCPIVLVKAKKQPWAFELPRLRLFLFTMIGSKTSGDSQ